MPAQEQLKRLDIGWDEVQFIFPRPIVKFGKEMVLSLPEAINELLNSAAPYAEKPSIDVPKLLLITGGHSLKASGYLDKIVEVCVEKGMEVDVHSIPSGEPTVEVVDGAVSHAREVKPNFIVGIGGGSVMDTAKALAGIYTNGGSVRDYHAGKSFDKPGLPFIAVPTTAGTGSEITNNAVIIDKQKGYKKSIRGENLVAKYIILDPALTLSCPPNVTAWSGADALVQAIEAYVSRFSNPLTDIYALQAIRLIAGNLSEAYHNGSNYSARAQMLLGSFFAGVAFSRAKLGLVHGLAHPIGYLCHEPHGKVCGALLPWVMEYNMSVRAAKYAAIAKELQCIGILENYDPAAADEENARRLIDHLKNLFKSLSIPLKLGELGVKSEDIEWIVANTKGGSADANPRKVKPTPLKELLERAL